MDERVYVPLRLVSESLGHQVQWLPSQRLVAIWTEEPANVVETDSGEVAAEDGPITITVDDTLLSADADTGQPYIAEEGYTMVPLRLVGEALDCDVQWQDGVVIVSQRPAEPVVPSDNTGENPGGC